MIPDHRHCPTCGRPIRPSATACPECFVAAVKSELERLEGQSASEAANVVRDTGA